MSDFYSSGWRGVGKEEEYVLVCFPGETWMSTAAGDPSQQHRGGGNAGVPATGRAAGSAGGAAGPSLLWPAEVALLSAAAARQGRGSAA